MSRLTIFLVDRERTALIDHFNHIAIILNRTVHLNGVYSLPDRWRPSIVGGAGNGRMVTSTNACCRSSNDVPTIALANVCFAEERGAELLLCRSFDS